MGNMGHYIITFIIYIFPFSVTALTMLIARAATPLRRIKLRYYSIAVLTVLLFQLLAVKFIWHTDIRDHSGTVVYVLFMLSPYIMLIAFVILMIHIIYLFRYNELKYLQLETLIIVFTMSVSILLAVRYVNHNPKINIPDECEPYISEIQLDEMTRTFERDANRQYTFILNIDIIGADESGYSAEATYFIRGRQLGITRNGEFSEFYCPVRTYGPFGNFFGE